MTEVQEWQRVCDEKHAADRARLDKLEAVIPKIFETLDKYKQRPSWLISGVITFLASALGIAVTQLFHSK